MRILRTAILTVAGGLLIAVVLFWVTVPRWTSLGGPVGRPITNFVEDYGGTDPWSGEFRPWTWSWTDTVTGQRLTWVLGPDGYQSMWAIALPAGFAVGSLLTLTVITLASREPRTTSPNPVVPTA